MPKIVDHDERRAAISIATLRVIQRDGVEGATIRAIAREGGISSGSLAHYFTDKEDIVGFAFEWIANRSLDRVEDKMKRAAPGLPRLAVPLELMLPDKEETIGAVVSLSFWARAANSPALHDEYVKHYKRWRGFVLQTLVEAQDAKQVGAAIDREAIADLLIAAIDGLCVSITLDGSRFSRARRKQLVQLLIDNLVVHD